MPTPYHISLGEVIKEFKLEVIRSAPGYEDTPITLEDVNRPGLQLTGFFDYFDPLRIELIGLVENTYLAGITSEQRRSAFEQLFSYPIPTLIITRSLEPYPECLEMAEKYNRTILRTPDATCTFMSALISFLKNSLAPRITRHGVLLEVYGEGVLLLGDAGVGKSETAIELVKRGHRLVADDAVDIRRVSNQLIGKAPELIRHYIELRGIGIIDLQQLFGMSAVKLESQIDLVVEMEPWVEGKFYDRFGLDELSMNVLGIELPKVLIPVRPGRNLASIVEVAAMNNRHKRYGFNSAQQLADALMNQGQG